MKSSSKSYYLKQFFASFLVLIIIPLIPLILEIWFGGHFSLKTLVLVAAIFPISLGSSSDDVLLLLIPVISSMFFSAAFGFITAGNPPPPHCKWLAIIAIVIFSVIHSGLRWRMHVKFKKPFYA